jgi:hypothetical protein
MIDYAVTLFDEQLQLMSTPGAHCVHAAPVFLTYALEQQFGTSWCNLVQYIADAR